MKQAEFDARADRYELALANSPHARDMEFDVVDTHLDPRIRDRIIGIGEGNGKFSRYIAEAVGKEGFYFITDPSEYQLKNLRKRVKGLSQIGVEVASAEEINILPESFDKVWSFGAFHHVADQTEAMKRIYDSLKPNGKAVICDVFQGSDLARHFDAQVARYCLTGHEVKFLSDEFARSLCHLAGFQDEKVSLHDLPIEWEFDSKRDLGEFVYYLHAMTNLPGSVEDKIDAAYRGCQDILGVVEREDKYFLQWPLKALVAEK